MYFAYSWPRVLSTSGGTGQFLSLHLDHTYFIAVSEWSVQVWSGGQIRLRLGQHMLSQQEVQQYGQHVAACWCPERSSLAVLVSCCASVVALQVLASPAAAHAAIQRDPFHKPTTAYSPPPGCTPAAASILPDMPLVTDPQHQLHQQQVQQHAKLALLLFDQHLSACSPPCT